MDLMALLVSERYFYLSTDPVISRVRVWRHCPEPGQHPGGGGGLRATLLSALGEPHLSACASPDPPGVQVSPDNHFNQRQQTKHLSRYLPNVWERDMILRSFFSKYGVVTGVSMLGFTPGKLLRYVISFKVRLLRGFVALIAASLSSLAFRTPTRLWTSLAPG